MSDTITKRDIKHQLDNDGYQSSYDEIAVAAQVKATQIGGKTWSNLPAYTILSTSEIDDENGQLAAKLHVTDQSDLIIEELTTGRSFLIKLANIIGAACQAIQFMDKHANNAHIARLYAEHFHPEEADMIAALKMVEQGLLYPALDKYGEDQLTPVLAFGRSLIDGIGVPDAAEETPED